MSALTLALAAAVALAAVVLSPGRALGVLLAALFLYPDYMTVEIGPADMTVGRIGALALVARLFLRPDRWFRPGLLDYLVIGMWCWEMAANIFAGAQSVAIIYLIGRSLDTVLFYLAARMALRSGRDLSHLALPLGAALIVVGCLGAMESVTARNPYARFFSSIPWAFLKEPEYRLGLLRAKVSAAHYIYFGMSVTLATGLLIAMKPFVRSRSLWRLAVVCGFMGAASSLSSGPWITLATFCGCLLFYFQTTLIKPFLVVLGLLAVFVEFASNRHVYELVDRLALSGHTAWYRGRLIEAAFKFLPEYWMFGYGGRPFHHWAAAIDGRGHVDVVNNYVVIATSGGLLALALYVGAKAAMIRSCVSAFRTYPAVSWTPFALASLVIALSVGEMSVGLFGVMLKLNYVILGAGAGLLAARTSPLRGRIHAGSPARQRAVGAT